MAAPAPCPECGQPRWTEIVCEQCGRLFPAAQPRNAFARLGLEPAFDIDFAAAEKIFMKLSRAVHPDFYGAASPEQQALAARHSADLNEAMRVLRDDWERAEHLLELRAAGKPLDRKKIDQALLMEVLEVREELESGGASAERLAAIADEYAAKLSELRKKVAAAFAGGEADPQRIQNLLNERKYYTNMIEAAKAEAVK